MKGVFQLLVISLVVWFSTCSAFLLAFNKLKHDYSILIVPKTDSDYMVKDVDAERAEHDYQRTVAKTIPKRGHKR